MHSPYVNDKQPFTVRLMRWLIKITLKTTIHPSIRTWPCSGMFSVWFQGGRRKVGEPVGEGGAEGGWVGGCGTLRRPRDSGLGQEAERVGANMRTSFGPLSLDREDR